MIDTLPVREYLLDLQRRIIGALQDADGNPFDTDAWAREPGGRLEGDGLTRLIEGGAVFERGGCNFSHVRGRVLPPSATQHRPELAGAAFEAMGVSLVCHPHNPFVPTVHMNVRMFAAMPADSEPVVWFGGGMDLTPYYGFERDAQHFHRTCKAALEPHGGDLYPRFKQWCDDYFFLKHRDEPRGVGGIFFDDYAEGGFDAAFAMMRSVGDAFLPAYMPIVERRQVLPYTERERDFQAYRRGRYVEFNLVFDRGTLFGLQSGGRTESILMSMPPLVKWRYDWAPEEGTQEARLYTDFLRPRDWADETATIYGCDSDWLFGGSFDPVHLAHLSLARCAAEQLGLDRLLWVPAGNPWQKPGVSAAEHRREMVRLMIEGEARFSIDDSELQREGASYTIDTVRAQLTAEPDAQLFLVIGQDQYARLDTWRDWPELLSKVTLAVAARAGEDVRGAAEVEAVPHRMQKLAMPAMQISSTQVREKASRGEDIRPLVGDAVAGYIARHRLYESR